ncbi:hypothetical protein VQ056_21965 [Paenibacillus sp. JTLBN-2024]
MGKGRRNGRDRFMMACEAFSNSSRHLGWRPEGCHAGHAPDGLTNGAFSYGVCRRGTGSVYSGLSYTGFRDTRKTDRGTFNFWFIDNGCVSDAAFDFLKTPLELFRFRIAFAWMFSHENFPSPKGYW